MDKDIVLITDAQENNEERVRQLVNNTLAPLSSVIDIIAVKIDHDKTLPLDSFDFHCTILLKIEGGAILRADAHDCDDILAVYSALMKILDSIPLKNVVAGSS
ncbi:MAG: hypothetical protein KAR42_11345 [candidate division Zixibacteria bacterium]|nr:hypothetical protein [candidate division Zixibacteria bacterium]